jgi:hypothetical protein
MVKMMNDDVITQLVSATSKSNMPGILPWLLLLAPGPLLDSFETAVQMG